jgi:hypothetical protein
VQCFLDRRCTPRTVRSEQLFQNDLHPGLALPSGQVQDAQVLLGRPLRLLLDQPVIDEAEATGGEQVVAVAVVGKRSWLAYQPVDDVPVVDAVVAPAPQARQALDLPLGIPDFDVVDVQTRLDPFPNQPACHRVGVARDVDGAAGIDPHAPALARLDPPRRERPQQGHLLGQTLLASRVQLGEQLP